MIKKTNEIERVKFLYYKNSFKRFQNPNNLNKIFVKIRCINMLNKWSKENDII